MSPLSAGMSKETEALQGTRPPLSFCKLTNLSARSGSQIICAQADRHSYTCNDQDNQSWTYHPESKAILSRLSGNDNYYCVTRSGDSLELAICKCAPSQEFEVEVSSRVGPKRVSPSNDGGKLAGVRLVGMSLSQAPSSLR